MVEVSTLSPVPTPNMTGVAPWIRLAREPRVEAQYPRTARRSIRAPRDVYDIVRSRMENEDQEVLAVLSLDIQQRVIACSEIGRGIANGVLGTPRGTFRLAIALGAIGVVLTHNHPSGDPTPSPDDRALTALMVEAGRIVGIPVLDHIIIGEGRYFSFNESGLL
jgi:DNA repair protein RadC